MYINWFDWILFFMIIYVIQKIGGKENSPDSLNIMVNYHYHGENRVITRYSHLWLKLHWTPLNFLSMYIFFKNYFSLDLYMYIVWMWYFIISSGLLHEYKFPPGLTRLLIIITPKLIISSRTMTRDTHGTKTTWYLIGPS